MSTTIQTNRLIGGKKWTKQLKHNVLNIRPLKV